MMTYYDFQKLQTAIKKCQIKNDIYSRIFGLRPSSVLSLVSIGFYVVIGLASVTSCPETFGTD